MAGILRLSALENFTVCRSGIFIQRSGEDVSDFFGFAGRGDGGSAKKDSPPAVCRVLELPAGTLPDDSSALRGLFSCLLCGLLGGRTAAAVLECADSRFCNGRSVGAFLLHYDSSPVLPVEACLGKNDSFCSVAGRNRSRTADSGGDSRLS